VVVEGVNVDKPEEAGVEAGPPRPKLNPVDGAAAIEDATDAVGVIVAAGTVVAGATAGVPKFNVGADEVVATEGVVRLKPEPRGAVADVVVVSKEAADVAPAAVPKPNPKFGAAAEPVVLTAPKVLLVPPDREKAVEADVTGVGAPNEENPVVGAGVGAAVEADGVPKDKGFGVPDVNENDGGAAEEVVGAVAAAVAAPPKEKPLEGVVKDAAAPNAGGGALVEAGALKENDDA